MALGTDRPAILALYRDSSEVYQSIEANWGETVTEHTALKLARHAGIKLADLIEHEGLKVRDGKVNSLDLVMAMGF
jgi:hypothetical protein